MAIISFRPIALSILALIVHFQVGCGGPSRATARVPYQRMAEEDLSAKYRTMAVKVVGEGSQDSQGLGHMALLPGILSAPFDEAELRIEIAIEPLRQQRLATGSGALQKGDGSSAGSCYFTDIQFTRIGLVRAMDRDGNEFYRDPMRFTSVVNFGFSMRGPGKNTPQGGDRRYRAQGAAEVYYSPSELEAALRMHGKALTEAVRVASIQSAVADIKKFVTKYTSGRDTLLIWVTSDKGGFLANTRTVLESGNMEEVERECTYLEAIAAGGYLDPVSKKELSPAYKAGLHANISALYIFKGNVEMSAHHIALAKALDPGVAKNSEGQERLASHFSSP